MLLESFTAVLAFSF